MSINDDYADSFEQELPQEPDESEWSPVSKMRKDVLKAVRYMTPHEARFLVDTYYVMQDDRKRADQQSKALAANEEPNEALTWFFKENSKLEKQLKLALDNYSAVNPLGVWAREIVGIGPVISAGLLAYLDVKHTNTAQRFYVYAGLEPSIKWLGKEKSEALVNQVVLPGDDVTLDVLYHIANETNRPINRLIEIAARYSRGNDYMASFDEPFIPEHLDIAELISREGLVKALSKRPWNASLKTLVWKIGQSFIKFQNYKNPDGKPSDYGPYYKERMAYEVAKNEKGHYAEQAARALKEKRIGKQTVAYQHYSVGKLPPAHIRARVARWTTKLFLSHFHEAGYRIYHDGNSPPAPFAFSKLDHDPSHYIAPPNRVLLEEMIEWVQKHGDKPMI